MNMSRVQNESSCGNLPMAGAVCFMLEPTIKSLEVAAIHTLAGALLLFMAASAEALEAEVLYGFQIGPQRPAASLVQSSDGNFYGTTTSGGSGSAGTLFQVTT